MGEEFSTDGMLDIYLYENEQLLEQLESIALEKKDEEAFEEADINEIFRIMHTIKGSSGIMMYDNITAASHKLEDVFYYLRELHPDNVPHIQLVEYVLRVSDFIMGELSKIKEGREPDGNVSQLIKSIDKFLDDVKNGVTDQGGELPPENPYVAPGQYYIAPVANEGSRFYKISIYYKPDTQMCNVRAYTAVYSLKEVAEDLLYAPEDIISNEDSAEVILAEGFHMLLQAQCSEEEVRKLIDHCSGVDEIRIAECSSSEFFTGFEEPEPIIINLDREPEEKPEGEELEEAIPSLGDYVIKSKEPGKGKKLAKNQPKPPVKQNFISVNVDKMDMLMDLIGELVIAQAVVLQNSDLKVPGLELTNFNKAAGQLTKTTTEMQDIIMAIRMVPLTNTFQKMKRLVFDISRKLNKDVELEVIGDTTEVDKNIIEHISDPLMHLIRNAVDHGIEEKAERLAAGKPEKGRIVLEAKNEGGKVYIIVSDDGKGLNKKKIFGKAKQSGLTTPNKDISEYTDKEVYQFITYPGFSTNEEVTEYSGRGVGMDVVNKNLQAISGRLEIDSKPGKGSDMILKIPLTLAIINGIVMQAGGSPFVIETGAIKEFVRVTQDMLVQEPDGEEYIMIRGECYPFIRLEEKYHLSRTGQGVEKGIVVLVEHESSQVCLFIDSLVDEQEIVVKPIPSYIKKVEGISGCTQLGDGSIALILDVAGLIRREERS